jgi:hypothetical protein
MTRIASSTAAKKNGIAVADKSELMFMPRFYKGNGTPWAQRTQRDFLRSLVVNGF